MSIESHGAQTHEAKERDVSTLLKSAVAILSISIASFVWARLYFNAHPLSEFTSMLGVADTMTTLAHFAGVTGIFGFVLGVALLVAALVQNKNAGT